MSLYCDIKKDFGKFKLDINLDVADEKIALMGASGCGKSMTLKCIAGIITPDSGKIILNGRTLFDSDKNINLPIQKRNVGMLFQDYALFPNMTAKENIFTAIKHTSNYKTNSANIKDKTNSLLEKYQLSDVQNLYPYQLSGGQKQRLALARMMGSPLEIILLDEPFSALDSFLRWQLEQEVSKTINEFGKTVILVSHNRDEVFRLCDKATIVANGKNGFIKEKHLLYSSPTTYHEALITGCKNLIPATNSFNKVYVPLLDFTFDSNNIPKDLAYIGFRAKHIIPGFLIEATFDYIVKEYEILSETEDVFSYILLINLVGSSFPIRWELSKEIYKDLIAHPKTIAFRKDKIMLLEK